MAKKEIAPDNELPGLISVEEIDPSIYSSIAKCAQLMAIQLIHSDFDISPQFFDDNDEGKLGVDFTELHGVFDVESRVTTTIFQFHTFKKIGRKKVFSIKDQFAVFYKIPIDCDAFHAVAFARRTGLMASYPFFRAHVAQTAALANAEMPIIPTIASMPLKNRVKKEPD